MLKRSIACILVLVLIGCLLIACEPEKETITAERAQEIALDDMGVSADEATVHIHQETRSGQSYYTVYVTTATAAKTYVISMDGGAIVETRDGSAHSH